MRKLSTNPSEENRNVVKTKYEKHIKNLIDELKCQLQKFK